MSFCFPVDAFTYPYSSGKRHWNWGKMSSGLYPYHCHRVRERNLRIVVKSTSIKLHHHPAHPCSFCAESSHFPSQSRPIQFINTSKLDWLMVFFVCVNENPGLEINLSRYDASSEFTVQQRMWYQFSSQNYHDIPHCTLMMWPQNIWWKKYHWMVFITLRYLKYHFFYGTYGTVAKCNLSSETQSILQ